MGQGRQVGGRTAQYETKKKKQLLEVHPQFKNGKGREGKRQKLGGGQYLRRVKD